MSYPETDPEYIGQVVFASVSNAASDLQDRAWQAPVHLVYNPLDYAKDPALAYHRRYVRARSGFLWMGMNPGPFGMVQTGVPFGARETVQEHLGITGAVNRPAREHPRRPIRGFAETREEVSGRRLWTFVAETWGSVDRFAQAHALVNYCPLAFLNERGANIPLPGLAAADRRAVYARCDESLRQTLHILQPRYCVAIGRVAESALARVEAPHIVLLPHPSPASPQANRDWSGLARSALSAAGLLPGS